MALFLFISNRILINFYVITDKLLLTYCYGGVLRFHIFMFKLIIYKENLFNKSFRLIHHS